MDASPLSSLPAELRAQIFEYVVIQPRHIQCGLDQDRVRLNKREQFARALPLTATCRQLREEVLPMVYGMNEFRILTWGTDLRKAGGVIEKWLVSELGEAVAGKLRRVELELECTPTEVLGSIGAIAKMFGKEGLRCTICFSVIWTESGYKRCTFPVQIVLQGNRLETEMYRSDVEMAVGFQREALKQSPEPLCSIKQDLGDLDEARKELLSLPAMLGEGEQ